MAALNKKASVIVPVYQSGDTVRKCVESLLLGNGLDLEIILVNDASKDHSAQVCRLLQQQYPEIIYLENSENKGVSYTRNRGLDAAQGDYIFFVDSDDWVSCEYINQMLTLAEACTDALPVCGYTFIDHTQKIRSVYRWDEKMDSDKWVSASNLFDLERRILIQTLWNKVFRREIIQSAHIRFDESLSMGEDFQFVLDYMEAAGLHQCVVLNRPLYYYIRANQTSLMSKWFDMPFDVRMQTYRRLAACMEDHALAQKEYALLEQRIVDNLIYQIIGTKAIGWNEKRQKLKEYIPMRAGYHVLLRIARGIAKERVYGLLVSAKRVPDRLRRKIIREQIRPRIRAFRRRKLKAGDFSIISQNCIGGVFYHEMGLQFLSPTINLFFREPDFMRFVTNLDHYLSLQLRMEWEEEYPIGYLDDVRIDFMHYDTCEEAKTAWERRKMRICKDRIVVIATDRNGFDEECFEQWKKLPYRKILYTARKEYAAEPGSVYYPQDESQGYVGNVINNLAFYKDDLIFDVINSLDCQ